MKEKVTALAAAVRQQGSANTTRPPADFKFSMDTAREQPVVVEVTIMNEKKQKDSCKEIEDEKGGFEIEMGEAISCEDMVKSKFQHVQEKGYMILLD